MIVQLSLIFFLDFFNLTKLDLMNQDIHTTDHLTNSHNQGYLRGISRIFLYIFPIDCNYFDLNITLATVYRSVRILNN